MPQDEATDRKHAEAIHDVFTQTLPKELRNGVIVRWVGVLDIMKPDGHRLLFIRATDGIPVWELEGMLNGAHTFAQAAVNDA